MILPFFLLFIVFLTTLVRLAVADMALYKSASESTELFVAYAYPVEVTKTAASDIIGNKIKSIERERDVDISGAIDWANEGLTFLGVDIAGGIENLFESSAEGPLETLIQGKFEDATGHWNFFDSSKLTVTNVELPSLAFGSDDYLEVNVMYEFDIAMPFVNKTIYLRKTAYERVWTGS